MISIVIPTYNQAPRLRLMLQSLDEVRPSFTGLEILVVNDGSTDETIEVLRDWSGKFGPAYHRSVLHIPRGGRSVARNTGARASRGDLLVFLDSDILADHNLLETHASFQRKSGACVRGTIFSLPWLRHFNDLAADAERWPGLRNRVVKLGIGDKVLSEVEGFGRLSRFEKDIHRLFAEKPESASGRWVGCTAANLSIPRALFERLGGFDQKMGLKWGAEDLELGFRSEKLGISIRHAKDAVVYHMNHAAPDRTGDHTYALSYFARKHSMPGITRLSEYFNGAIPLEQIV